MDKLGSWRSSWWLFV